MTAHTWIPEDRGDITTLPRDEYDDAEFRASHDHLVASVAEVPPLLMRYTDWAEAFARPPVDAIVDGFLIPGRWTSIVAPAKAGKSTLGLSLALSLSQGRDPFTAEATDVREVHYLDGEMGELDVTERLVALGLTPADLGRFHYTEMPAKGDTVEGGAAIVSDAHHLGVTVVVLDGLNAFISGGENDDTCWRALYEQTIAPLKRMGCAVMSTDNTGHVETTRGRGSSVKLDKPDAIYNLKKIDGGVKLHAPWARSSAYQREIALEVVGTDGETPISYQHSTSAWPAGTKQAAALLDRLGVPLDAGRNRAREALKAAGESVANEPLSAAIRWRKLSADRSAPHPADTYDGQGCGNAP